MATKTPALSTRLKLANAEIESLRKKIESLESTLKNECAHKNSYFNDKQKAEAEIEQVHALLDALPGSGPRKTEGENSWDQKTLATMTRLAAYLANRSA